MDIGKRPSRQRRHLPMAFESEKKNNNKKEEFVQHERDDQDFMQRSSARCSDWAGNLRRRKKTVRPVLETTLRRTEERVVVVEQHKQNMVQALMWISCGGWALFLLVRVVYSVYRGDYEQLNVVYFLTH